MNIAVRLTEKELALSAHVRRLAFHQSIADKAAELKAAKLREATEQFGTPMRTPLSVHAIAPEAMPAEPDPPALCPHCGGEIALDAEPISAPVDEPPAPAYPPIAKIQAVVGKFYNVTRNDLCSARRTSDVVRPRQIAMYLSKEMTPFSMPAIGRRFGGRDHTTVLHAVRKIQALMIADAWFCYEVVGLIERAGLQPAP